MRTPTGVYHSHIHHRGEVTPVSRTACVVSKNAPESQRKHTPHRDSERPQVMVFSDGLENPDGCRPQSHTPPGPKNETDSALLCVPKIREGSTTYSPSSQECIATHVIEGTRAIEEREEAPRQERSSGTAQPEPDHQ